MGVTWSTNVYALDNDQKVSHDNGRSWVVNWGHFKLHKEKNLFYGLAMLLVKSMAYTATGLIAWACVANGIANCKSRLGINVN